LKEREGENLFLQPVVFVIGAGAHAEYGMPTGAELKNNIASAVNFGASGSDLDLQRLLSEWCGRTPSKYEAAGRELAKVIPSFPSIDEALNWFSSLPEIIEVGKVAIVRQILSAERASPLADPKAAIPAFDFSQTWLPHFISMVMSSLQMERAGRAFERVTVINFNYDRIIEQFLYFVLQDQYGLNAESAKEVISGLKMFRPYGTVGNLEWQQQDGPSIPHVPFGAEIGGDHNRLFSISTGIRTFTEQHTLNITEIQQVMDRARMVVFLGFGFHEQNLKLLQVTRAEPWRRAFGTTMHMNPENKPTMQTAIQNSVGCGAEGMPLLLDWRAHVLLNQLRPALMAAASM
jgi:hypothetical protein